MGEFSRQGGSSRRKQIIWRVDTSGTGSENPAGRGDKAGAGRGNSAARESQLAGVT